MGENKATTEQNSSDLKTANIMVAGKTGTGKSTLLNAIFGEDLAKTGTGRPITEHIREYMHDSIPIHIWDTVGLELNSERTRQSIEEIKSTIASKSNSKDELDQIHAIWYCVNSCGNRFEGLELEFIKELYSIGVPFTIVLTQCYGAKKKRDEFVEFIKNTTCAMNMKDISVIPVLALDYEIEVDDNNVITKHAFGLDNLVNTTMEKLPEYVQRGFIAAQKVSESLKHNECEGLIWKYVEYIRDNHWSKTKIINWNNVPLINILVTDMRIKTLFRDISKIYNTEIPEDSLDDIVDELGGLSPENAFNGLLNPVSKKFDKNVEKLFHANSNGEYNENFSKLPKNMRVARMLVLYGYTFLEAIEIYWERLREEKIESLRTRIDILVGIIREKCKDLNGKHKSSDVSKRKGLL